MEAIDTPMNYKGDGTWFFSAELTSGYYELDVTPHLFLYKMLLPDGKKIEGTIPTLLTKIENHHGDPELTEWLTNALSWKDRASNYEEWKKKIKFKVNGKSYTMTCNPRTGDVELYFGQQIYVANRCEIASVYPEIHGIKQGGLSELIAGIVADSLLKMKEDPEEDPEEDSKYDVISLPVSTDRISTYDINGWEVSVGYNPNTELLALHLSSRIERTHISTIEQDVWEFTSLHNGKYREEVIGILGNNGFMDARL